MSLLDDENDLLNNETIDVTFLYKENKKLHKQIFLLNEDNKKLKNELLDLKTQLNDLNKSHQELVYQIVNLKQIIFSIRN